MCAILAGALPGCALTPATARVDGVELPRPTLRATGQPYQVVHERAHPRPGGPSSGVQDEGGELRGQVCGVPLRLHAAHMGDHVEVTGQLVDQQQVWLEISERAGQHVVTGHLASWPVELALSPAGLTGRLGGWHVQFVRHKDALRQWLRFRRGQDNFLFPADIGGVDTLLQLPAAEQAVVLPMMVACLQVGLMIHPDRPPGGLAFGGPVAEVDPTIRDQLVHLLPAEADQEEAADFTAHHRYLYRSWTHYTQSMLMGGR